MGGNLCAVNGKAGLVGASMVAGDLRGGAALAVAGLCADSVTTVGHVEYIKRGYENFAENFEKLGADIKVSKGKEQYDR